MIHSKKTESILLFLIGATVLVILNQLGNRFFFRVDLTEEKRFSISQPSKELLKNLEDIVYIDVYLDGDLPAPFKRMQKSIREMLDEFKIYSGPHLEYNFIDPSQAASKQSRNEFHMGLARKGIQPTNLFDTENGKKIEKLIFPGAIVSYKGKETGVMLLKGNKMAGSQERINQSIEGAEYELISAINNLEKDKKKRIGFLYGHHEMDTSETVALQSLLAQNYQVLNVDLPKRENLFGMDAIIMAQPKKAFNEDDKYKIDQFIMHGGKALFFIDPVAVNMDSAGGEGTVALPVDLNLDDMFFKYGVRFNKSLILDLNAGPYPVVVGNMGDQPQIQMLPWPFFPLINTYGKHPISRNLDGLITRFISSTDTVKSPGTVKEPLFFTSKYSRIISAPATVKLNDLRAEFKPEFFNAGSQPVAWLLEGSFNSLYKNRFLPDGANKEQFIDHVGDNMILVCSDGDILKNERNPKTNQPFEIGYDPFSGNMYANGDFILNALSFMLDEHRLIGARNKEILIRPLDSVKIKEDKQFWQTINIAIPILLILVFGILKYIIRKNRYAKFNA